VPKLNKSLKPIYSYRWAEGVVQEFTEKLWRGTAALSNLCNISVTDCKKLMIFYLRCDDQCKWKRIKLMVKIIEEDLEIYKTPYNADLKREYLDYVRFLADDLYLDELEGK
jgi:hypothetical protein